MNDQLILEYIARTPDCRAQQVADKLDVELAVASAAIRSLVEVGDLVRKSGTAPNGMAAQLYNLSDTFCKSKEGRAIMARLFESNQAATAPAPAAPAATAAVATDAAAPPVAQPVPGTPASPVTRALDFLAAHGSATDAELRTVMGLRAGQYPSSYLAAAIKSGKCNKDGKEWKLGPGKPAPAPQPAFGGALSLPGATPHPRATVAVPTPTPTPSPAPAPSPAMIAPETAATAPTFRCGLWSDGVLELQRNGVTVAELAQGEGETVAAFMARLHQPLEAA